MRRILAISNSEDMENTKRIQDTLTYCKKTEMKDKYKCPC